MESSSTCELFDKKFDTKFKFVDCNFVGTNDMTMEVHNGKFHTDIFDCGICEYVAETEEDNLDLHLFTCEIYHCTATFGSFPNRTECTKKYKNLSEMKRHVEKEHDENTKIKHIKISKNNPDEVTWKSYYLDEL